MTASPQSCCGDGFIRSFRIETGRYAYDAQRLSVMAREAPSGDVSSYAIVGALALYLDFVNLFLFVLRFTGRRRDG